MKSDAEPVELGTCDEWFFEGRRSSRSEPHAKSPYCLGWTPLPTPKEEP